METKTTTIVGIGNTLLSDEGVGVHALHYLQEKHPALEDVIFIDGGTLGFSLAAWLDETDNLIVLDAAQLNSPPGTVKLMEGAAMDDYIATGKHSAHDVGFLDLLSINRMTSTLPENRALIGIQPENLSWGTSPTEKIGKTLPEIEQHVLNLLTNWRKAEKESAHVQ